MKKILLLLLIIPLTHIAYTQQQQHNNSTKKATTAKWKTYMNTKYGFAFQYPITWTKIGADAEVIDRSGKVTLIEINFKNPNTPTTLIVNYHLPPSGIEIYKYAALSKGSKQTDVAGAKAIEDISIISTDGRGDSLVTPLKLIVVNFLDKKQTNEIELQFKTPLNGNTELQKFKSLLSTFKFTN